MVTHLLEYFHAAAARVPEKTAFTDGEQALTFARCEACALALGRKLFQLGCAGKPVGILMDRTPAQPAAFLGVWEGGGFYVPLDREMPRQRLLQILQTAAPVCLVCDRANEALARELFSSGEILLWEEVSRGPALRDFSVERLDTDPAYIVFTSGSTGMPKGVCACHRSVIDYAEHFLPAVGMGEDAVLGCQSPLYFDAFLKEFLSALVLGTTVVLIPRALFVQPVKLVEFLNEHRVNTLCWVASALSLVSSLGTFKAVRPRYLKLVCFGSEVFPPRQLGRWREACPGARFFNLYGPTECTGMSCFYPVTGAEQGPVPIGRPFANTRVFLLDETGRESREGEIYIAGTCVTLGYYNDPERTAAAFVQNPLQHSYPERVYRTGDLARYDERGDLVFLGRKDQQIKHMGHRIELGEIEAAAGALPGVDQCVCLYAERTGRICLAYTGDRQGPALMEALAGILPRYMLPNTLIPLAEMPLTPNGKADRRRLGELYGERN